MRHENSAAQLNFSQAMLREIDALKIHSEVKCSNKYLRKYLSLWQSQQFLSNSRCSRISGEKTPYFRNFTNRWRWIHLGGSPAAAALLENAQDRNHQTGLVSVTEPNQHGSEKKKTCTLRICWLWMGRSRTETFEQLLRSRLAYVKVSLCQQQPARAL